MATQEIDYANPIDITLPLNEKTILYPGDKPMKISQLMEISKGESLNMSEIRSFNIHAGTHVDLPSHFVDKGLSLEDYDLSSFMGEAEVCEIMNVKIIDREHIQGLSLRKTDHIILKTNNSQLLTQSSFNPDYCYLTESAAEELLKLKPKSIGFDYYSLDPSDSQTFDSHMVFARANVPVFVCLNLSQVTPGPYWFSGTPLALTGIEASPVRAILFRYQTE